MAYDPEQLEADLGYLTDSDEWRDEQQRPQYIRRVALETRGKMDAATHAELMGGLWGRAKGGVLKQGAEMVKRGAEEVVKSMPAMGGAVVMAAGDALGVSNSGSGTRLTRGAADLTSGLWQRGKRIVAGEVIDPDTPILGPIGRAAAAIVPGKSQQARRDETLRALKQDLDEGNYPEGLEGWLAGELDGGAEPDEETKPWLEALTHGLAKQAVSAYTAPTPEKVRAWLESDRNPWYTDSDTPRPGETGPRELLADYLATRDPASWEAFRQRVSETDTQYKTRLRKYAAEPELRDAEGAAGDSLMGEMINRSAEMQGSPIDLATALLPLLRGSRALQAARAGRAGVTAQVAGGMAKEFGQEALTEGLQNPNASTGQIIEAGTLGALGSGVVEGGMATAGRVLRPGERPQSAMAEQAAEVVANRQRPTGQDTTAPPASESAPAPAAAGAAGQEPQAFTIPTNKGRAKMAEKVLTSQGVDPEAAALMAARLNEALPDDLDTEAFREQVLAGFAQSGGVLPGSVPNQYVEDAAAYEAAGYSAAEAAEHAANARAANERAREDALERNRDLVTAARIAGARSSNLDQEQASAEQAFAEQVGADLDKAVADYEKAHPDVLDRDLVREQSADYQRDPGRHTRSTTKVAGLLVDHIFKRWLRRPSRVGVVVFNAGGPASGKSATLNQVPAAEADFTVDGTLQDYDRAKAQIDAVKASGRRAQVRFVYSPFKQAVRDMITRAITHGRYLTPVQMANGHHRSARNVLRLAAEEPNAVLVTVVDNSDRNNPVARDLQWLNQRLNAEVDTLTSEAKLIIDEVFDANSADPSYSPELYQRITGTQRPGVPPDRGTQHSTGNPRTAQHQSRSEEGPAGGPGASSVREWSKTTFGQRLRSDERLRSSWRQTIGGQYRVESEAEWQARANAFIAEHGIEGAFTLLMDPESGLSPSDQVALGLQLILSTDAAIRQAERAGDTARVQLLDDLLYETSEHVELMGTRLGQGVRVFGMWTRMSAEGVLRTFERKVDEAREDNMTLLVGGKPDEVAADVADAATEELADATSEALGETTSDQLAELQQQVAELRQQLAEATAAAQAAGQQASVAPTPAEAAKAEQDAQAAETERQRVQRKLKRAEARQQKKAQQAGKPRQLGQKKPKPVKAEEIAKRWIERLAHTYSDTQAWRSGQAANAMTQLIRDYIKGEKPDVMSDFVGMAMALGLSEKMADQLRTQLDTERRAIAAIARERAILRLVDQMTPRLATGKTKARIPRFVAKLLDAHELGALTRPDFLEAYAEAFDLPVMDSAMRKRIQELITRQKAAPDGFLKQQATTDLMGELAKFKGIGAMDIGTAFWYANILSGLSTQGINLWGNATHLILKALTIGATHNPRESWQFVRGLIQGASRGLVEAGAALKDGAVPYRGDLKFSQGQVLELIHSDNAQTWGQRWKNGAALGRFVFRALAAGDAFFYHTSREGRAWLEAARYASSRQKLEGGSFADYLAEQLGSGPQKFAQAMEQARAELDPRGMAGNQRTLERRAWEILEQGRAPDLNEEAQRFGTVATFTQEPEGTMGAVAQLINDAHRRLSMPSPWGPIRVLTPFIPFVNIVANVSSIALDYTPVGIARGVLGRHLRHALDRSQKDFTPWEAKQRLMSGILGTLGTGMAFAWAFAMREMDDDEVPFMIYGMGPDTKARRDQMPQGWKPFTIKVGDSYWSYSETPLALVMAVAGNTLDYLRYNPKGREEHAIGAATYALATSPQALLKTGVLSSINDIFEIIDGNRSGKQFATRFASGFIPGQALLRDVSELFHGDKIDDTSIAAGLLKDVPIIRPMVGKPALNVFGEPIKLDTLQRLPIVKRIVTGQGNDADALWMARNKLWIAGLDKTLALGKYLAEPDKARLKNETWRAERVRKMGRAASDVLTEDEKHRFVQTSGPGIRRAVREMQALKRAYPLMTTGQMQEQLNAKVVAQRRLAMREVLGLR